MYIVCVTACPVGIAHTYMAAANLKKAIEKDDEDIADFKKEYSEKYL
mgnify:CR=1 FL=1